MPGEELIPPYSRLELCMEMTCTTGLPCDVMNVQSVHANNPFKFTGAIFTKREKMETCLFKSCLCYPGISCVILYGTLFE